MQNRENGNELKIPPEMCAFKLFLRGFTFAGRLQYQFLDF